VANSLKGRIFDEFDVENIGNNQHRTIKKVAVEIMVVVAALEAKTAGAVAVAAGADS
jgi:hypothetical protein